MLSQRIQEIHDTIGEDSAILDQSELLNEEAMYAVYERKGDQLSLFDEGDEEFIDITEAEEILRQLKKEEPEEFERIKNIPDGIRARRITDIKNYYVFCEAAYPKESNLKNYQQLYLLDEKLKLLSRDISFILSKIKADRYELSGDILPDKYNQSVMLVKKEFSKEVILRESERKYSYALTLGQRYVIRELRLLNSQTDDEDTKIKITLFESSFRGPITSAIKNELNRLRLNNITGEDLITSLSYLYTQHNMSMWLKTRKKSYEKPEIKIVCSEYI